jgi:hypothetical protein
VGWLSERCMHRCRPSNHISVHGPAAWRGNRRLSGRHQYDDHARIRSGAATRRYGGSTEAGDGASAGTSAGLGMLHRSRGCRGVPHISGLSPLRAVARPTASDAGPVRMPSPPRRGCNRYCSLVRALIARMHRSAHDICYCHSHCAAKHADKIETGSFTYGLPKGWCGFGLAIDQRDFERHAVFRDWCVRAASSPAALTSSCAGGRWQFPYLPIVVQARSLPWYNRADRGRNSACPRMAASAAR